LVHRRQRLPRLEVVLSAIRVLAVEFAGYFLDPSRDKWCHLVLSAIPFSYIDPSKSLSHEIISSFRFPYKIFLPGHAMIDERIEGDWLRTSNACRSGTLYVRTLSQSIL